MPQFPSLTKKYHSTVYPAIDPTNAALAAKGKVVIVTGGGRGIGKAIAESFATAGAKVIAILGRTESTLKRTADEIIETGQSHGHKVIIRSIAVDISNGGSVKKAFSAVSNEFGNIDVVVGNAGDLYQGKIGEVDLDAYWRCFEINTRGTINCMQSLLEVNAPQHKATFIHLSTIGITLKGAPGWTAYAGSKIAAFKIAEGLVADASSRVRSFIINPGHIATDMSKKAGVPTPDDAALPGAYCVWLAASPEADFLQGRLVACNWDVIELLEKKEEIVAHDLLSMKLTGIGL